MNFVQAKSSLSDSGANSKLCPIEGKKENRIVVSSDSRTKSKLCLIADKKEIHKALSQQNGSVSSRISRKIPIPKEKESIPRPHTRSVSALNQYATVHKYELRKRQSKQL